MAGLLGGAETTEEEQEANDGHASAVVVLVLVGLVLLALLVYAWLFTNLWSLAGLPSPLEVGGWVGLGHRPVFTAQGHVVSSLDVDLASRDAGRTERLAYFSGLAVAFVFTYFAPVRWKRRVVAALGLGLLGLLFGPRAAGLLLAALLCVYATFHPTARAARPGATLAGALAALAFTAWGHWLQAAVAAAAGASLASGVFEIAARWVLPQRRRGRAVRLLVAQSALVASGAAILLGGGSRSALAVPFGLVLFFWQFERLIFYANDVEDGAVPEDVPLLTFLSVFVSPPLVLAWTRGLQIGQGYSYQATVFLSAPKNRLILSGLRLWALALVYLVVGDLALIALGDLAASVLGVRVYTLFPDLLRETLGDRSVSPATVLGSTFLSQLRWYISKAGPVHFMVGAFRILGYDVAAHYDSPLLATNLVSLWARFTFHYREFLGRVFYYPVFFALARRPLAVRITVATFAAAGVGNLVWGHAIHASVANGLSGQAFLEAFRMWPYFVLLSGGITLTELWFLRRGRSTRKPWTWDRRIPLDVLAAYATFQFFALIEVFFFSSKFPERSLAEHFALVLRAVGLTVGGA